MKKFNTFSCILITAFFLTSLGCGLAHAQETEAPPEFLAFPIVMVLDGGHIGSEMFLPAPLNQVVIHIDGIDVPSFGSYAKCKAEHIKGIEARAFLKAFVDNSNRIMLVSNYHWGKKGGRISGDVLVDGRDLGELMLENKYAARVEGHGEFPWCALLVGEQKDDYTLSSNRRLY